MEVFDLFGQPLLASLLLFKFTAFLAQLKHFDGLICHLKGLDTNVILAFRCRYTLYV
jgi:hypothetical protein